MSRLAPLLFAVALLGGAEHLPPPSVVAAPQAKLRDLTTVEAWGVLADYSSSLQRWIDAQQPDESLGFGDVVQAFVDDNPQFHPDYKQGTRPPREDNDLIGYPSRTVMTGAPLQPLVAVADSGFPVRGPTAISVPAETPLGKFVHVKAVLPEPVDGSPITIEAKLTVAPAKESTVFDVHDCGHSELIVTGEPGKYTATLVVEMYETLTVVIRDKDDPSNPAKFQYVDRQFRTGERETQTATFTIVGPEPVEPPKPDEPDKPDTPADPDAGKVSFDTFAVLFMEASELPSWQARNAIGSARARSYLDTLPAIAGAPGWRFYDCTPTDEAAYLKNAPPQFKELYAIKPPATGPPYVVIASGGKAKAYPWTFFDGEALVAFLKSKGGP